MLSPHINRGKKVGARHVFSPMRLGGSIEQAYEGFLSFLLVVDGSGHLAGLLQRQNTLSEGFELIAAKDSVEAIGILEERDVAILAIDGRSADLDPLAMTTSALHFNSELTLIFVTEDPTPAPSRRVSHGPGPIFVNANDFGPQLGLILGGNGRTGRSQAATEVDALDVTRIAGLQGSSGAVQILAGISSGTLCFEDGVLVHAACGSMAGPDAFFAMMLWPRGEIQKCSDEEAEACETNVWLPSSFLFQEAERFWDALRDKDDDPEVGSGHAFSEVETGTDRKAVWQRLLRAYPAGVRVIVACSKACEGACFRKMLGEVGESLGAGSPWVSEASDGPTFARVHPGGGGTLAMTRVPLTRRLEYLFETLSKSAEATLLCGAMDHGRVEQIRRRSSQSLVATIGGNELTSADLWGVLEQIADRGSGGE